MLSAQGSPITNDVTSGEEQSVVQKVGPWILNTHSNQLIQGDIVVELEYRLTNLLVYFLHHKHQILSKDDILRAIWQNKVVNDDSLSVAISKLRKALDDNPRTPKYIKTIPGVGYQFIMQATTHISVVPTQIQTAHLPLKTYRLWIIATLLLVSMIVTGVIINVFDLPPFMTRKLPILENNKTELNDGEFLARASRLLVQGKKEDLRSAIPIFRQAIAQNSQAAEAYLGIAEAKIQLLDKQISETDSYSEIHSLLLKSLSLDPTLARAHMWLGYLLFEHDHNYIAAEEHFKISVALNPNDDLSHFLYEQFLLVEKRFEEAREQITLARTINPLSYPYTYLVWVYLLERKYDLGRHELERIASTEQQDSYFHTAAQNIYYGLGNEQKVFEHMQWFFDRAGYSPVKKLAINDVFMSGGLLAVYTWLLEQKETVDLGQYPAPLAWARYAVAVGKKEAALDFLEQAYEKHQFRLQCATVDPRYDSLRNEPRFKILLQKLSTPIINTSFTNK